MTIAAERGARPGRAQDGSAADQRIASAIAAIRRDLGPSAADLGGRRPDISRRVRQLIALLPRMAPEWGQAGGPARAQLRAAALSGALALAGAIDQPRLSNALREAALRHLTPDGA